MCCSFVFTCSWTCSRTSFRSPQVPSLLVRATFVVMPIPPSVLVRTFELDLTIVLVVCKCCGSSASTTRLRYHDMILGFITWWFFYSLLCAWLLLERIALSRWCDTSREQDRAEHNVLLLDLCALASRYHSPALGETAFRLARSTARSLRWRRPCSIIDRAVACCFNTLVSRWTALDNTDRNDQLDW